MSRAVQRLHDHGQASAAGGIAAAVRLTSGEHAKGARLPKQGFDDRQVPAVARGPATWPASHGVGVSAPRSKGLEPRHPRRRRP